MFRQVLRGHIGETNQCLSYICTKYEFCETDVEKRIATADFHLDSYESA